tara:strand:+ start:1021 stop:1416 length:396 start_codon:yes stop_codon:yes gene_type:complete
MRNFKNNHKRGRFRSNSDRNFKRNGVHKHNQDFTNGSDFQRKSPGRNNQNASKLINKYMDLAREALSNGDKILSENYFQHADHFARISSQQTKKEESTDNINSENNNNIVKKEETAESKEDPSVKIKSLDN